VACAQAKKKKKRAGKLNKKNPNPLAGGQGRQLLLFFLFPFQPKISRPCRANSSPLRTWVTCRLLFIFLPVIESVLVLLVCLFAGPGLAIHRNRSPPPLLGLLLRDNISININIKQHPSLANKQSIAL
jgi:hypothetical protein